MKFNATTRNMYGTSASRRLRHKGRVPAVIYGKNTSSINIELDHNEIYHVLLKEKYHAAICQMELDGNTKIENVLIRSAQWHVYKPQVLHVDFQRVNTQQELHIKIPLRFLNAEDSPAVKISGANISHIITELSITCFPKDLPQFIEIDLSHIPIKGSIHLSDIKLPEGLKYNGDDSNPLLALAIT
ncbi:MAG: 50S ribosomal protein L25/general stress protein Ctc [Bordetella sp.]|nr:MAG: 50S ribosomal protein L25/general stress protein Ctc [Bordetella sp.]